MSTFSALPTYFGPEDETHFGVVHVPQGHVARGGIVLVGSIAKEQMDTVRGMRYFADRLAERGIAVLRFDYLGVGDSEHDQIRPDSVEQWIRGVHHAVDFLRAAGVTDVGVVGLRLGSLMADAAMADLGPIRCAVMWDPVSAGRAFIRELQALYRMSIGDESDDDQSGELRLVGATLSPQAASALGGLSLRMSAPNVESWLIARRRAVPNKKLDRVAAGVDGDDIEIDDMEHFVAAASFLVDIPISAIDAIVNWIDPRFGQESHSINPHLREQARFAVAGSDSVIERIEKIVPFDLFAIRTMPVDAEPGHGRAALLVSTANDLHIGPNREWVELARRAAACGMQVLRFDRRGVGETGAVLRAHTAPIYDDSAIDDVLAAARWACVRPADLLVGGVCSGSWYAAQVARSMRIGHLLLINAIAWSWRRKRSVQGDITPADLGVLRSDPTFQNSFRGRVKALLQRRLPYAAWRLLGSRGITQVPEVMLKPVARAGVPTTIILSPHDEDWFVSQRGPEGLRRLAQTPTPPVVVLTGIGDHTAYHRMVRQVISEQLMKWAPNRATQEGSNGDVG